MRIRVLGCGNELAGDDAAGLIAVRALAAHSAHPSVEVLCAGAPGVGLLDLMSGYDLVILVDAVISGSPPGTIHRLRLAELPAGQRMASSAHDLGILDALTLGQLVQPEAMPRDVILLGVEAADVTPFHAGLSQPVRDAIPALVTAIERELSERLR